MTFMVFKGTECCALECELNKAEAVGKGRSLRWAGVMGYDATLNGLLLSHSGKSAQEVEKWKKSILAFRAASLCSARMGPRGLASGRGTGSLRFAPFQVPMDLQQGQASREMGFAGS